MTITAGVVAGIIGIALPLEGTCYVSHVSHPLNTPQHGPVSSCIGTGMSLDALPEQIANCFSQFISD